LSEIKRFPFTPILGWSATRYDTFSICRRKYYYQYYAKYDSVLPKRRIDRYKELVSIPLEVGGIVHQVVEVLLNRLKTTAEDVDRERFFEFAQRETEHHIATQPFEETVYGLMNSIHLEDLFPKIEACLGNLLESGRFEWLVTDAIPTSDRWVIDPPGYGESRLGDLKVYFKVDFLFPVGKELHIVDWKTGKKNPDKHRKQLLGYSTWASYHFDVGASRVRPSIAYLQPEYEEVREQFDEFDLESFAIQIRAETDEMYEYCRDVANNIPLAKSEFPKINDDRISGVCKFRGLCFPEKYPSQL
jgi:hypothetical protein